MSRDRRVPYLELLEQSLVERMIDEAFDVLERTGVFVENAEGCRLLENAGMRVSKRTERGAVISITRGLVEQSLKTVPSSVKLYARGTGHEPAITLEQGSDRVHFNPGSSAPYVFDGRSRKIRAARAKDLADFTVVADALANIDAQSTAMIPADVPGAVADRYRLFLVLRNSTKPVVTGTFTMDGLDVMKQMLVAVRGSEGALKERPLAIFSVCPSPPLKWSNLTCHDLIHCARAHIPVEIVPAPLAGVSAPVTLAGTIVQHTAETLSGLVLGQLAQSGAPVVYGGSPAAFDMRTGTAATAAIEAMMMCGACSQIGRHLGLPTQAYLTLSDAKMPDAQAGFEAGTGAMLAALCGVNLVAGPGMLAFESCQSLEKLVIDNEVCGMAKRLIKGITPRTTPLAEDLLRGDIYSATHFLTSPASRRWLREEFFYPGEVLDRDGADTRAAKRSASAEQCALRESERILAGHRPVPLNPDVEGELIRLMNREAAKHGMERLPVEG
ncbi:MAG: trimethylamine methyltransferase family protein [Dehalococcoidia bacterium]